VLARAPIVVEATTATVSPESVTVPAGSEVSIRWTGPDNKGDYVTIVAQGAAEGDYLDYTYTRKGSPVQIRVPDTPGAYEIRYVTGQSRSVLASAEITVEAVTATLEAPATVAAEEPIEVAWTGPDNKGDYITIVLSGADAGDYLDYAYTRKGSPVTVEAPEQPGSYEIRYITAQSRSILASRPITVQ
jgi:Ca-activated chloride channel family protein